MRSTPLVLAYMLLLPPAFALSLDRPLPGVASAEAGASLLLGLGEIAASSSAVIVGTPGKNISVWEEAAGRRIVTYTQVHVDRTVAGEPGTEVWIRTLGGVVGDVGQEVSGEPQMARGEKSLLFLRKRGEVYSITGRAQGLYPIVTDKKGVSRVKASPDAGLLVATPGPVESARDTLAGKLLDSAIALIRKAREASHEKKD